MKFSLLYLPTYRPELNGSVARFYGDMLDEIEFADQNGFNSVWFAEHHFYQYGGVIPSVPVIAAAAAQRTRRLRIGSSVALIGLNDPVRVAEEFAMLDNLSGGRVDFGIGRAFQNIEYEAFEVPMDESRARFDEAHEIILKAWADGPVNHAGRFRTLKNVDVIPKPVQRPHPPIYVACIMTPESFAFTGGRGYNLMYVPYVGSAEDGAARVKSYRDALGSAGHDLATHDVMMCLHTFIGESPRHARDYPRPYLTNYFELAAAANRVDAQSAQYQGYAGLGKVFKHIHENYDFMYPNQVIFGDPEQSLARIAHYEAMGATHISLITNFGGMPHAEIMRSLERFVKHVMPHVKPTPQSAAAGG
ncbi:MAG: LLM class flavin-dependent oxidoreductase [Candidatus Binataceae bacterium]|nr:LLM class flavin-dependent oxidoreductase [Candidatus Binataceae bacterium]